MEKNITRIYIINSVDDFYSNKKYILLDESTAILTMKSYGVLSLQSLNAKKEMDSVLQEIKAVGGEHIYVRTNDIARGILNILKNKKPLNIYISKKIRGLNINDFIGKVDKYKAIDIDKSGFYILELY